MTKLLTPQEMSKWFSDISEGKTVPFDWDSEWAKSHKKASFDLLKSRPVLWAILSLGHQHVDPIATHLHMDPRDVTKHLQALRQEGLVAAKVSPTGETLWRPTPKTHERQMLRVWAFDLRKSRRADGRARRPKPESRAINILRRWCTDDPASYFTVGEISDATGISRQSIHRTLSSKKYADKLDHSEHLGWRIT